MNVTHRAGLPVIAACLLSSVSANGQSTDPETSFREALTHIDALEAIAHTLAQTPGQRASATLAKICHRLATGLLADASLTPQERALRNALRTKSLSRVRFDRETGGIEGVCQMLQVLTGVPVSLTPEARAVVRSERPILELVSEQPVAVAAVLDAVANTSERLVWRVRGDHVEITTTAAEALMSGGAPVPGTLDDRARDKLSATIVEHRFAKASLDEWSSFYAAATGLGFVVSPAARAAKEHATLTAFALPAMPVDDALDAITARAGLRWSVRGGRVCLDVVDAEQETERLARLIRYHEQELQRLRTARARLGHDKK